MTKIEYTPATLPYTVRKLPGGGVAYDLPRGADGKPVLSANFVADMAARWDVAAFVQAVNERAAK